MAIRVEIQNEDFAEIVSDAKIAEELRRQPVVLGEEENQRLQAIYDALPGALARRLRRILPEEYEIKEIQMTVSLSGKPLGIGISGDALVKFGPKPSRE